MARLKMQGPGRLSIVESRPFHGAALSHGGHHRVLQQVVGGGGIAQQAAGQGPEPVRVGKERLDRYRARIRWFVCHRRQVPI